MYNTLKRNLHIYGYVHDIKASRMHNYALRERHLSVTYTTFKRYVYDI